MKTGKLYLKKVNGSSAMLVVMQTKELREKGTKVGSLMGNWFVLQTDWMDCQFVGGYCEMNEEHSTLGQ
jgi:hypothetical protein